MLGIAVSAKAGALSFMTLDNPDAPVFAGYGTRIFGINASSEMVGSYLNASFYTASFTYSNGVFASLNYPSAIETDVARINNAGQISGSYYDGHQNHGFLNSGNSWTSIDFPGAMFTSIRGSNATGEFVGAYSPDSSGPHGFIYNGTYTTFDVPGALSTAIANINDNGDFVGTYQDPASDYHGFLHSGGVLTHLDFPGSIKTFVSGINNAGEIVGSYENRDEIDRGFIYGGGVYTAVNYPVDVPYLQIFDINDSGQMVGGYAVITDFPGSFPNPVVHGFIAAPVATPEPNGAALFGFGAAFLIMYARGRRCADAKSSSLALYAVPAFQAPAKETV
jgi:hypothetical protein